MTARKTSHHRESSSLPKWPAGRLVGLSLASLVLASLILAGCSDPIYDSVSFEPTTPDLTLAANDDLDRYSWPLTRSGYVVAKPPQMAYVTSFSKRLTCPDPVEAELVPWSKEDLDEYTHMILEHAYRPASEQPQVVFSLDEAKYAGPQSFDVSPDGTRLAVIENKKIVIYDTQDGSVRETLPLPGGLSAAQPPAAAIRFCGGGKELLVASQQKILRLDAQGSPIAETNGCGEPIAQWIVNDDDQSMIIRTESGKLFGGSPDLDFFSAYNLGKNVAFDQVSLSPDGTRIGVCVDGHPRTYVQDNFQVIDQVSYDDVRLGSQVAIFSSPRVEAWTDGQQTFHILNDRQRRSSSIYPMLWRPQLLSPCSNLFSKDSCLAIARRLNEGQEEWVLYDYLINRRINSRPIVIDEFPDRIAHSREGGHVALADSQGLHLINRPIWQIRSPALLEYFVYDSFEAENVERIEKLAAIIKTQSRYGFGMSSEQLWGNLVEKIANRWRYLDQNDPDHKTYQALESWLKEGSQLALLASALRHYKRSWNLRENRRSGTGAPQNGDTYAERQKRSSEEMSRVLEMGNPPLIALKYRIHLGVEQGEGLDDVDKFCRQACQLYPGELDPHHAITQKLLPGWLGETGDSVSFALSASKMFDRRCGDLLYLRLISRLAYWVNYHDRVAWRSYDANRLERGFEELIRRGQVDDPQLWTFWGEMQIRMSNPQLGHKVLKYLMKHNAAFPYSVTHGNQRHIISPAYGTSKSMWGE
ncbi:MAG: hypothetical protein MI861_05455 [Pirellulales bacterium]|nr:hypothetical protein [Pirellulales bacterium]